jgi:HSP20 family molecular chaperone IbpA
VPSGISKRFLKSKFVPSLDARSITFDGSGRLQSCDLADWFQAEVEFVHPVHIEVSESSEALTVRAEVPGFKKNELQINAEPRRVTIAANEKRKETPRARKPSIPKLARTRFYASLTCRPLWTRKK